MTDDTLRTAVAFAVFALSLIGLAASIFAGLYIAFAKRTVNGREYP